MFRQNLRTRRQSVREHLTLGKSKAETLNFSQLPGIRGSRICAIAHALESRSHACQMYV